MAERRAALGESALRGIVEYVKDEGLFSRKVPLHGAAECVKEEDPARAGAQSSAFLEFRGSHGSALGNSQRIAHGSLPPLYVF